MAPDPDVLRSLADFGLVLGLGGLIGIERERHRPEKTVLAGVRTYPLVALTGFLSALFARETEHWLLVSVGAAVAGGFALAMYYVRQRQGTLGLTSPIALFATYFVGVLVAMGHRWEGVVTGLAIVLLLFTKDRLHKMAEVLTPQELEGALYFLVLAFILLPLLPTEPIDPWGLFRLRQVLVIVLAVSAISFLSFLALRRYGGEFGLPFTGFLGGLVNSEATTASLAERVRERKPLESGALTGILLANGTMFLRNLAIAAIADPSLRLLKLITVPLIACCLVWLIWAVRRVRSTRTKTEPIKLQSPFAFKPAFWFALWFTLVSVATVVVTRSDFLGASGIYVTALGGLVSAGAVVASMAALVANGGVDVRVAAVTAIVAVLFSASNKVFIARRAGASLSGRLVLPTLATIAIGVIALVALQGAARM